MMFGGEYHQFETCILKGFHPLFGVKLRRVEQRRILLAVAPFAISKGVDAEVQECGKLQILPCQLIGCGHCT